MQGDFDVSPDSNESNHCIADYTTDPKRSRLDAVANNAPWKNLLPANDKETQQRMRRHQEEVAKYSVLTSDQRKQVPRVSPYPESPDRVFPGTPCYRMTVNGEYIYVFVIDPASPGYGEAWDGRPRPQQQGYWIVPHFIYRDPDDVEARKERWKKEYDRCAKADPAELPPSKTDYTDNDSGTPNDCYYSPGVDNEEDGISPPPIKDPLFTAPFNTNASYDKPLVKPYPYNQNKTEYPVRTKPTLVPIASARGADDDGGGRRRQRRAVAEPDKVKQYHDPHKSLLDVIKPSYRGREGTDWVSLPEGGLTPNYEVGADYLKAVCEQAEELDYNFAQSMQGLRGTNISAVWTCTDPEYDITDRATVLAQFVRMYMEKFYTHISVMGSTDVEEVVHEALRLHEEFCKGWVHRHHRTLAPEITAASEALVGQYYDDMKSIFPPDVKPTRAHISRFLRRHPDYCGEFSYCLYHYMTSLEHMRGNRNPSYKAMAYERNAQITALRKVSEMLFEGGSRIKLIQFIRSTLREPADLIFDLHFIDWHYIAAQMPQHHKEFDGFTNSFNLYRSRMGGRANAFPPWQQMRMAR